VWQEDLRLYPDLQAGVTNPVLPGPGLLSRREERIHHFQRWIADRVGSAEAPEHAISESPQEQLS
jgi:hypothetical protein